MSKPDHVNSIQVQATKDNYSEILLAITKAVDTGGKVVVICDEMEERKATADERRLEQNALMWVWNAQVAKYQGERPEAVHGENKMNVLLPMMKVWGGKHLKMANFIDSVLDKLVSYTHKVRVSYDMVRTKDLSVKYMAEFLTEYKRRANEAGIQLESNSDLEFKSLMVYADSK